MNRILFLDNSLPNDTYRPLTYWEPLLLFPCDAFRVSIGELTHELDSYSHILITGSAASVLDDTEWMQAELALIQNAVNKGKVILGSCFGHQIIARSLFGMNAVRKREKPEIGWGRIFESFPVIHYSVNPAARSIHLFFIMMKCVRCPKKRPPLSRDRRHATFSHLR